MRITLRNVYSPVIPLASTQLYILISFWLLLLLLFSLSFFFSFFLFVCFFFLLEKLPDIAMNATQNFPCWWNNVYRHRLVRFVVIFSLVRCILTIPCNDNRSLYWRTRYLCFLSKCVMLFIVPSCWHHSTMVHCRRREYNFG